ncbi:MAG: hypothetical protein FWD71_04600 [Oscillospiraceae bacterium]|nr:hypothetical protein [Oscillospiraceae bacterium]
MKKMSKVFTIAIIAIMLCPMLNFGVFAAADPIVIDFSKYDYVEDVLDSSTGGDGEFDIVNDGDKRVLYAECTDGYDPADDPDGTSTKGDLYSPITNFADLNVNADTYQWIKFGLKNESAAPGFEVHFSAPDMGIGFSVSTSITFDINPNSGYTDYVFNVTDQCKKYYPKRAADVDDPNVYPDYWHGLIDQLRLDFMYYEESGGHAKTGDKMEIEYIAFFDSEAAANAWTYTPARTAAQYDAEKAAAAAATTLATTLAPTTQQITDAQTNAGDISGAASADTSGAPDTTAASSSGSSGNAVLWIIIAVAAVIVIVIIVVLVTRKKK